MVSLKTIVVVCVVAAVVSIARGEYATGGNQQGMPYEFQWTVNQPDFGNDFGQQEHSDGDVVQGQYYVQLPDGRLQTVTYKVAGGSGYVADVQYEGEARFPSGGGKGVGGGYH